jgi:GAF domain-containing protein
MGNEQRKQMPEEPIPGTRSELISSAEARKQLLRRLIVGQTVAVSILAIMTATGGLLIPGSSLLAVVPLGVIAVGVGLVANWLLQRQKLQMASYLFLVGTAVAIASLVYLRGYEDASALYFLWPIVGATILLETRGGVLLTILCTLFYGALVAAQWFGYQTPAYPYDPEGEVILTVASRLLMFFLLAFLGWLSSRNLSAALQQTNQAAQGLRELNITLEQRVARRTEDLTRRARHLEATAAVARDAASMLDLQQLLSQSVNLVSEEFGFYHTGIFLMDPTHKWAVLQAASSEGGRQMLARRHRLGLGKGIVGYVAEHGQARIALDVGEDAVFFDNPDLPKTRSEMALPLKVQERVIGVLDVQSREAAAFSPDDVSVLQTLADQLAVAINNAELFLQAQERLEAERRAFGELSRRSWAELLQSEQDLSIFRDERGLGPIRGERLPSMEAVLQEGQSMGEQDGSNTSHVPIRVRGQVVGVIDAQKPDGAAGWSPRELDELQILADQLGMTLDSARLFQEARRRAARDRLLGEVTARMRESLDMDTVLRTAAQEIRQALGLARMGVQLAMAPKESDED